MMCDKWRKTVGLWSAKQLIKKYDTQKQSANWRIVEKEMKYVKQ